MTLLLNDQLKRHIRNQWLLPWSLHSVTLSLEEKGLQRPLGNTGRQRGCYLLEKPPNKGKFDLAALRTRTVNGIVLRTVQEFIESKDA